MSQVSPVHFLDGCAAEAGIIYMPSFFDELDQDEYEFSRMVAYVKAKEPSAWFSHDVKFNVVSVCMIKGDAATNRRYCGLSAEGDVDIYFSKKHESKFEKIPDAGVRDGIYGAVTHMREIGSALFVCGQRGQVYQRFGDNDWRHIDEGLRLEPVTEIDDMDAFLENLLDGPCLNCIDGFNERDLYTVGDSGGLWHYNGSSWRKLSLPTDEHLQWVRCYGSDEVWICGFNGTLLRGNAQQGFVDVSAIDNNNTYWCLAKLGEQVYLSTEAGLEVFDGQRIQPVLTGLKPELQDGWRVDVSEGVLWTFGPKDIAYFDGKTWIRIHDPDNPRIGENESASSSAA